MNDYRGRAMPNMLKDDILYRLQRADEDAYLTLDDSGYFKVVIVGGGALILYDYIPRATEDIDVLCPDRILLPILEAYDINAMVAAYANNFPYNYEDRLVHIFTGRKIEFYTASLEDIIIAKLCSCRRNDWLDAETAAKFINWDMLDKLANDETELKSSILNDRNYADFLANYEEYERRFRR
jgi:hypothetical protein